MYMASNFYGKYRSDVNCWYVGHLFDFVDSRKSIVQISQCGQSLTQCKPYAAREKLANRVASFCNDLLEMAAM